MKDKSKIIISIALILAIGNYTRISATSSIRTVEFLSIFVIGALAGILLVSIIKSIKETNKISK